MIVNSLSPYTPKRPVAFGEKNNKGQRSGNSDVQVNPSTGRVSMSARTLRALMLGAALATTGGVVATTPGCAGGGGVEITNPNDDGTVWTTLTEALESMGLTSVTNVDKFTIFDGRTGETLKYSKLSENTANNSIRYIVDKDEYEYTSDVIRTKSGFRETAHIAGTDVITDYIVSNGEIQAKDENGKLRFTYTPRSSNTLTQTSALDGTSGVVEISN
ncbi:MAG: hypothetical protein PHC64_08555 [Candidatus Gastranaerophilales bacterium]|nr:hypothetical protein [Candidatus Gastranaerophilales bacterium]